MILTFHLAGFSGGCGLTFVFTPTAMHRGFEVLLNRWYSGQLGLDETFQVLARVDQAFGANHAGFVDQDCIWQLANPVSHTNVGGEYVGEGFQVLCADKPLMFGWFAVAGQHNVELPCLGTGDRFDDRQKLLADWAGRRKEEEHRAFGFHAAEP